ncbi:MAG: diaminopimelate epimerase [Pseudomonadota bacterium]
MEFNKSHGLGNDYLIADLARPPTAGQVRLICDRNHGMGSDGLLWACTSERAAAGLRIYNPDGSEAEISGNGLRIFAHWLHHHRGAPQDLTVEVGGRMVACHVEGDQVRVAMGRATFVPAEVPVRAEVPFIEAPLPVAGLRGTAVGMGNPHCVVFVEEALDTLPWRAWGEALERCDLFPNRTNVQIARVLAEDAIEIRIWERGAGPTLASGSSACAAAAAAVRTSRCRGRIQVEAPGGVLHVEVGEDFAITLEGPVEEVGSFTPAPALLARWERG